MKTKLLAILLLAGCSVFARSRVSIGVNIGGYGGPYYAPPPVAYYDNSYPVDYYEDPYYEPPCPGPGYTWTSGYWYYVGPRRLWHAGYWAPPVYRGGYYGGSYYRRGFYDGGYRGYRGYERHEWREHPGRGHAWGRERNWRR